MIINGYEEYIKLKTRMDVEQYVQTRIHRDFYAHPSTNPVLCCIVTFLNGETYVYSVSHNDAPMFETLTSDKERNADVALYRNAHPLLELSSYFTPFITNTHMMFGYIRDINKTIPLTVWAKVVKKYHTEQLKYGNFTIDNTYNFLDKAVNCLREIESAGIAVDVETFKTFFDSKTHKALKNNYIYSQYYPYTLTGRPSNRFGGINFAALNKSDGSRSAFVSRFENGQLLQLDFEAYHLRLIANYMQVKLPDEPVHEYLAKQYFETETPTAEEYEQGKQITFSILYGVDVETNIPLLKNIKRLSKDIYHNFQNGGLIAPISGRTIQIETGDAAENKLFNYFVQNLEFESTVDKLSKMLEYLKNKQSKLVLYTYDAVLVDCHPDELEEITNISSKILRDGGYPVRIYTGSNYDKLQRTGIVF
jgi:hypothetical protein